MSFYFSVSQFVFNPRSFKRQNKCNDKVTPCEILHLYRSVALSDR